jgi:hypothetical protein
LLLFYYILRSKPVSDIRVVGSSNRDGTEAVMSRDEIGGSKIVLMGILSSVSAWWRLVCASLFGLSAGEWQADRNSGAEGFHPAAL